MCNFLLYVSHYSIALNLIFTAYTLSPTFPNCRSSLEQMEPTPSQVRNHYSQKNQEAHLVRALAFKTAAKHHFPSNVRLPFICLLASYCGWLISPVSWLKQDDDDTNQDIGDDESEGECENTGEFTLSSDVEEDNSDHQQEVLLLGQVCRGKSLRTTGVPLPTELSRADTVTARPLPPNCQKPPGSMAPPQLKRQKSAHLNKSSESDHAPSAQALPQPKSSGDQNAPQPKASADQNVPQHQKTTSEVARRFMGAIVIMKTPWAILSDDKYSMVYEAWKLAIEDQDHQQPWAGAPVGTPSVCQLPSSPSLKIDSPTWEAVRLEFCLMPFYQIYKIGYARKYSYLKLNISICGGRLADEAHRTVVHSY